MKRSEIIEELIDKQESGYIYLENPNRTVNLGHIAVKLEYLGINDPLNHLFQYLKDGENTLPGIKEDLETDIAERLPDTPFVSRVMFEFLEDDFISSIGKISMKNMTKNNLNILAEASKLDKDLAREYERALAEAKEPEKLKEWFLTAKTGSFIIFESLPIGRQKIAISRIYRKIDDCNIEGSFLSLYQPSVHQFNRLRRQIGSGNDNCQTEIDILDNHYEFFSSTFRDSDDFVEYYRYVYDFILSQDQGGKEFKFGLAEDDIDIKSLNGIDIVRSQSNLTEVYFEALKILSKSSGKINYEMIDLAKKINLNLDLEEGDIISMELARNFLQQIIVSITRVVHRANGEVLSDLSSHNIDKSTSYAVISHYSQVSGDSNISYANSVCPTYNRENLDNDDIGDVKASEYNVLARSFNLYQHLDNFGTPRLGVCIIKGCPSRGSIEWLPSRTIVGGCSICANCHKIFETGKSPEKIYQKDRSKRDKKSSQRSL